MPSEQTPILRTMEVSDVIDAAIRLYRHNFTRILGMTALAYVPVAGLQAVLIAELMGGAKRGAKPGTLEDPSAVLGLSFLATMLLAAVLLPLAEGACCVAVSESYLGRQITVAQAYRRVYRVFWRLFLTVVLVGLVVASVSCGAFSLAIIPAAAKQGLPWTAIGPAVGILLALAWMAWSWTTMLFTGPVVVLEGTWGANALTRSHHLIRGQFWRVLGTWFILVVIIYIGSRALATPLALVCMLATVGSQGPSPLGMAAAQGLTMAITLCLRPVKIIGTVLLYYDARIRKEGFDLQVMAANLGHDPAAYVVAAPVAQPALWETPATPALPEDAPPQPPDEETPSP